MNTENQKSILLQSKKPSEAFLPSQLDIARYLLLEIHSRQASYRDLCNVLNITPEHLRQLLAGHLPLSAAWCLQLGQHWDFSGGLLWNWQQDVLALSSHPFTSQAS